MYELISCVNDRGIAGVKVSVTWDGRSIDALKSFELRRYFAGESDYKVLHTGNVNFSSDLTYTYDDIETIAGVSYTYEACVINTNNVTIPGASATIRCEFEGILLADSTGSWHSAFGTSDSRFNMASVKNKPINYIVTLSGKFPHRVSNSQANYWTGTCNALWLPKGTECGEPTTVDADRFRIAFIDWLMSDTEKFMKVSDGKALIVSIDGNPRENYSPTTGLTTITFDWTQVGEVPAPAYTGNIGKAWVSE